MAGPEKTIQNKSLDKFKTKFDMTQTQAPQLRRSMTIPGQLQEQEKEHDKKRCCHAACLCSGRKRLAQHESSHIDPKRKVRKR